MGGGGVWGVGSHGTRSNEVPESDNVFEQSKCVGIYIRGGALPISLHICVMRARAALFIVAK